MLWSPSTWSLYGMMLTLLSLCIGLTLGTILEEVVTHRFSLNIILWFHLMGCCTWTTYACHLLVPHSKVCYTFWWSIDLMRLIWGLMTTFELVFSGVLHSLRVDSFNAITFLRSAHFFGLFSHFHALLLEHFILLGIYCFMAHLFIIPWRFVWLHNWHIHSPRDAPSFWMRLVSVLSVGGITTSFSIYWSSMSCGRYYSLLIPRINLRI